MISIQARAFNLLLKLVNKKALLKKQFTYNKFDLFCCANPPRKFYSMLRVDKHRIHAHNVFTLQPKSMNGGKHILYLHGGAYVQSFVKPHWDFLFMLIKNLDCTISAPDYPLAPTHTYKQSVAMVSALYKEIIQKVDPKNLILMGDSAGGGFALALAQLMRNENVPQPSQIILLSPWLDLTLANPDIKDIDPSDLFLGVEGLQMAGKAYSGDADTNHFLLSPINGSLEGLGKISILIGSREILVADTRKLKTIAESQGTTINYYEYPGMFHAWMLLNLPESKKAKKQIIDLVRTA